MDYNAPPNSWTFGKAQQEFELSSGLSNTHGFGRWQNIWPRRSRGQIFVTFQNLKAGGNNIWMLLYDNKQYYIFKGNRWNYFIPNHLNNFRLAWKFEVSSSAGGFTVSSDKLCGRVRWGPGWGLARSRFEFKDQLKLRLEPINSNLKLNFITLLKLN